MQKRVLVVDDSPTDNEALCMIARAAGYQTLSAFDGESGVQKARLERPDLVIMDVVMPGINGFQACKMITKGEGTSSIPVLICSNKHQETDKTWGERSGARHYFVKPASPQELAAKLKELIG